MKALFKATDVALLGLRSILTHKVRSLLTALSILCGVWSVIAMLAINEGASYQAQMSLRKLGTNNLLIRSSKPPDESSGQQRAGGALDYGLTRIDARRLVDNLPGVVGYALAHRTLKQAIRGSKQCSADVYGAEPGYSDLARLRLLSGRLLDLTDELRCHNFCVITDLLAQKLFSLEDPLGKTLRLGGEPFVVVGLIEQPTSAMLSGDADNPPVFIPASVDRTRFGEYTIINTGNSQSRERVEVSQIILEMADEKSVLGGAAIARSLLDRGHDSAEYEVKVPLELIEQQRAQRRLWNIMFFAIASVSLVVGGIGIMNIMLASVTERTREIGVRRALGAKRRDITVQFLVEAVTLTALGGLVGVGAGMLMPMMLERVLHMPAIISAATLIVPLAMAVGVGLASGLYPAIRAARLDPIVALRHE